MWLSKSSYAHRSYLACLCGLLFILCMPRPKAIGAEPVMLSGENIRIRVSAAGPKPRELVEIRGGAGWTAALDTQRSVTQVRSAGRYSGCSVRKATPVGDAIVTRSECGDGTLERELRLGPDGDTIAVKVRLELGPAAQASAVEDRLTFAPGIQTVDGHSAQRSSAGIASL